MYGETFPFDFDRPHAVTAVGLFRVTPRVQVSAAWRAASGFPVTPIRDEVRFFNRVRPDGSVESIARTSRRPDGSLLTSIEPDLRRLGLRNTARLTGYARTDLRGTYTTGGHWEFYGEILNVFNQRNFVQPIQSSASGMTESATYKYFERLPSFGIRVRF